MSRRRRGPGGQFVVVFFGSRVYHREMPAGVAACNVGGHLGEGGTRMALAVARKRGVVRPCGRCYG